MYDIDFSHACKLSLVLTWFNFFWLVQPTSTNVNIYIWSHTIILGIVMD